ncbi:MAG: cytidylate kinase-like family protein [Clostridiaceae bacterium]|nr:cytidylate kinase-like family protein [Clostridiaceae bacterium]
MAVITISREYGSAGDIIAEKIAESLGYQLVNKKLIEEILIKYGLLEFDDLYNSEHGVWGRFDSEKNRIVKMLNKTILAFARRDNCVILGRGAFAVLQDQTNVINIFVREDRYRRINNVFARKEAGNILEAEDMVEQHDRVRSAFLQTFYGLKADDPSMFDLCINTELADPGMVCSLLEEMVKNLSGLSTDRKSTYDLEEDAIMQSAIDEVLRQK